MQGEMNLSYSSMAIVGRVEQPRPAARQVGGRNS